MDKNVQTLSRVIFEAVVTTFADTLIRSYRARQSSGMQGCGTTDSLARSGRLSPLAT